MIKPGGRYRFYIKAAGYNQETSLVSGFIHPFPTERQAVVNMTGISNGVLSEEDVSEDLSYDSDPNEDELKFYIECDHCFVKEFETVLFPEYYRVIQKTISDVTTGDSYQYTYQYDNASPNTPFVSDAVNESVFPYSNLYTYPMREYRGNAQTILTDPGGLSSIQWYHQDDLLKGQSYHNLAVEIDYSEHFSGTVAGLENNWGFDPNTHIGGIYYQDFDPALYTYVSGSNLDGAVTRIVAAIQEGEFSLFHFRLNESSADPYNPINPPGDPAASLGLTNGSEYFHLWIEADTSHQYGVWLCNTNNDCNATGTELLAPGSFEENRWYAAIFQVDEGGSLKVKLWQLDEPENNAIGEIDGYSTQSDWRYNHTIRSGALYIDSYMEGILYQETETSYQSSIQYDTIANNAIPDLASTKLNSYLDLQIAWKTISQVTTRSYEGSVRWVGTQTQYSYTSALNYGNLESQTESEWDGSAWSAFRQNRYLYYPFADASHYLVSLPASQEQYRCENADCSNRVLTAATRFLYDNNTTYQAAPSAGLLTTQRVLLTNSPATYQDTQYEYDPVGNIVQITNYRDAGTETTLASTQPQHTIRCYGVEDTGTDCVEDNHHTYLLWEKNDLGHETQWEYDYKLGLPTQETDPNGAITYAVYDGLGRILQLIRPSDNSLSPTLSFAYHQETPFWTSVVQKTGEGQNNTLRKIYDGLGRLIQSQQAQQQLVDGNYDVLTEFTYDFRGNKISEYMPQKVSPYTGIGAIYQPLTGGSLVANAYDILGRIISTIAPDDTLTTTSYGLDSNLQQFLTQVTDAKEQTTTYRKDAFGRTVAVEPATGPGVTYEYDSQNRLTDSDYGGAETYITYDLAGRKTGMQDADMGGWTYGYDALGNLTSQTDAEGQVTCLYYDDLNRLLGKNFQSSSTCPQTASTFTVSFDYDASSSTNSGIGYRTSMDDASGSTAWEYDLRGRVIKEEKSILDPLGNDPLGTYHSYYSYYSDDQIKQMVLPNGEALDFDYLAQGALNAVSSDHWESGSITTIDYLKETQYDEAGRVVSRTMGNDVSQIYDFNDWETAGSRLDILYHRFKYRPIAQHHLWL